MKFKYEVVLTGITFSLLTSLFYYFGSFLFFWYLILSVIVIITVGMKNDDWFSNPCTLNSLLIFFLSCPPVTFCFIYAVNYQIQPNEICKRSVINEYRQEFWCNKLSGKNAFTREYKAGVKHGLWIEYYDVQLPNDTTYYLDGLTVNKKEYYSNNNSKE